MDINFELYKIFYHAAAARSFSLAAERLFITQSAVSQAIKNLETKLGTQLFFRTTRQLKLTPEGELLQAHIEQAYNFIKVAETKLSETHDLTSGEIRIGASDTVCKYFLLPYLQRFNQAYPGIKIKVTNRTSAQILEILKNGGLDLGIITLPALDANVTTVELVSMTDIFVASNKFNILKGKQLRLAELTSYPLLLLERASATRRNFDAYLQQHGISVIPEIELESVDLLVEFARIGLGVAHVVAESAIAAIDKGDLFQLTILEDLPSRRLGVATLQNVPLSQAAHQFIADLRP